MTLRMAFDLTMELVVDDPGMAEEERRRVEKVVVRSDAVRNYILDKAGLDRTEENRKLVEAMAE